MPNRRVSNSLEIRVAIKWQTDIERLDEMIRAQEAEKLKGVEADKVSHAKSFLEKHGLSLLEAPIINAPLKLVDKVDITKVTEALRPNKTIESKNDPGKFKRNSITMFDKEKI